MGGSLLHGKSFRADCYQSSNGHWHYEVSSLDGDFDGISYSTWREMKELCLPHGVPEETWPDFTEFECVIDVPLDQVLAKQIEFAEHLKRLPQEVITSHHWLQRLAGYVDRGEVVFFC